MTSGAMSVGNTLRGHLAGIRGTQSHDGVLRQASDHRIDHRPATVGGGRPLAPTRQKVINPTVGDKIRSDIGVLLD
jgi:hypothetical protein